MKELTLLGGADGGSGGVTLLGVVVEGEEAYLDDGALHGRSRIERGITFSETTGAVAEGARVWIVWVGVRAGADGCDGYFSAVASLLVIDGDARVGFRPATHFTDMIAAIQGELRIDGLSDAQREAVKRALMAHDREMWRRRSGALRHLWPEG